MVKPFPRKALSTLLLLIQGALIHAVCAAAEAEGDPWEADWDLESRIAAVNEGQLRFLPREAVAGRHLHFNRIRIGSASLRGGWIALEQCHEQLDAVPSSQILFNPGRIRGLRILSAQGIGRSWVDGHGVELEDVGPAARLCVAAETQALGYLGGGRYRLRNGPYMRRFLDGYYPMRVVLEIRYPPDALRFEAPLPASQPGFEVRHREGELVVDATFEGRLYTCMDFVVVGQGTGLGPAPPCPVDGGPRPLE